MAWFFAMTKNLESPPNFSYFFSHWCWSLNGALYLYTLIPQPAIRGRVKLMLQIGYEHDTWVADIADECLLGMDFLVPQACQVDLKDGVLYIGDEEIPLAKPRVERLSIVRWEYLLIPRWLCLLRWRLAWEWEMGSPWTDWTEPSDKWWAAGWQNASGPPEAAGPHASPDYGHEGRSSRKGP